MFRTRNTKPVLTSPQTHVSTHVQTHPQTCPSDRPRHTSLHMRIQHFGWGGGMGDRTLTCLYMYVHMSAAHTLAHLLPHVPRHPLRFAISQSGTRLTVRRTDSRGGWGMNLKITCVRSVSTPGSPHRTAAPSATPSSKEAAAAQRTEKALDNVSCQVLAKMSMGKSCENKKVCATQCPGHICIHMPMQSRDTTTINASTLAYRHALTHVSVYMSTQLHRGP